MAQKPKEDPDNEKTWEEAVREEQQFYYEVFGDRDWDCYTANEMEFLYRNVGHAMFGPPKELPDEKNSSTGYSEKQLEQINKLCSTIKTHGKYSSDCSASDVLVSVIFVSLNMEEKSVPYPVFRIPNSDPKAIRKVCPDQFVDLNCRVYRDWHDFLNNNLLPKCTYCYPRGGIYDGNHNDEVILEFGRTPASRVGSIVCSVLDTASSVVTVGAIGVAVAALCTPVAAPLVALSTAGSVVTGVYGAGRNAASLVDRGQHKQSVGMSDAEARNHWLSVAGNVLGIASGQAVRYLTKVTQNGQVVDKAGRIFVNALNYGSLTVNGLGLINNFANLYEKYNSNELSKLEVFQFASSCLFFTMSAVNIKTADAIIKETQTQVISDFETSLRSNRHRRMFRRVAKQTQGEDGNTVQGNAKVIRGIAHISDKDDFFAGLVRVQKQMGKSGATVSLTDQGLVEINGHLEVHPMDFSGINKVHRQVILDATKNLSKGTWTQEQFNQEMQAFCQEQNLVFRSHRTETVASVEAVRSSTNKKSALFKMNDCQIDTLTFCMKNFAKEHYQKVLSIAIELSESLGLKRTAEFLRVVQFVVNYVEQVAAEMEKMYQADLQAAQISQGQNFNREEFDYIYHVHGNSMKHFISSVLNNYNTYELLPHLKAAYKRMFPSEANLSDVEGNAEDESLMADNESHTSPHTEPDSSPDNVAEPYPEVGKLDHSPDSKLDGEVVHAFASSVINVCCMNETTAADHESDVLYKKYRDFKKFGDLSDNEIYMIVQEVTGLHLFEGNTRLYRQSESTFVTVTDPHIIPLTVMVYSNRDNHTVTAGLIM